MMRFTLLITILAAPVSFAFSPMSKSQHADTAVNAISRRDALIVGASGFLVGELIFPEPSMAFSQQLDDNQVEESQMPTNGKYDLNSAFVGDYKQLRGMFPHAAGKIASNGPYEKVKDIYKIPGVTKNDLKLFKKYESEFTVNPPGRNFKERINARVST
mmetsp:Transcript_751/g.882  ORF Transcript_751/g.882 Transcript_751/m.882 type:complete len:159 (+) Transcript_751:133-609(+)